MLKNHREAFKNVYVQSIPPSFLLRNLERVLEISIFKILKFWGIIVWGL